MQPHDPLLEEAPLRQFFFSFEENRRKKLLVSTPVSFCCSTAHSCEVTCVNLGCHKPGSNEVVILI